MPASVVAGNPATFTATVVDSGGSVVTGYTGTVHFASNYPNVTVPANYTFTAGDAGSHRFSFTAMAAGAEIVWVNDTANAGIQGTGTTTVTAAAAANYAISNLTNGTHLSAGKPATFDITAYDSFWNLATGYNGRGVITSSDPAAILPASPTFSGGTVSGVAITFQTASGQSVTATDSALSSMTDTAWATVDAGPVATITAPARVTTGRSATASVPSQTGVTYQWTIANGTITAGQGTGTVTVTAGSVGSLTLTCVVTQTSSGATGKGTATVAVLAAPVTPVITAPGPVNSGSSGYGASVPAHTGMTYGWTISGGTISGGTGGVTSGGLNRITYTAGAAGTLTLTATEVNAAGTASSPGSASVTVVAGGAQPVTPVITAAANVTTGSAGNTASVVAHAGMTYSWTIAGGTTTSPGGAAGVTNGGVNSITYTAGAVGTLNLSAVESNGTSTSTPGTATVNVADVPQTPVITGPAQLNGGSTSNTASVVRRTGMFYSWTISGGVITSPGGSAGLMGAGVNTITFSVGFGRVTLGATETNAAGTTSSPASLSIPVNAGAGSAHVYFVAHQDDDLYFDNPDIDNSIQSGHVTRVVFLIAAGSPDPTSWQARENGILNAYTAMAGTAKDWSCGAAIFAGKQSQLCTLNPNPRVSIVFMRFPDGQLSTLWSTTSGDPFYVTPVSTLTTADGAATYSRSDLLQSLLAIINDVQPSRIGTLDSTFAYGDDHQDHVSSALFTMEAARSYARPYELRVYRGYTMYGPWYTIPAPEVANLSTGEYVEKLRVASAYDGGFPAGSIYDQWMWRQYVIGRLTGGTGPLVEPGGNCLDTSGGASVSGTGVVIATCSGSASQRWTVNGDGTVIDGAGKCLTVGADGTATQINDCAGAAGQKWTELSNGQVRGVYGACLGIGFDGSSVEAQVCHADTSGTQYQVLGTQHWTQQFRAPAQVSSGSDFSDATLGAGAGGSASVNMADVNGDGYADACVRLTDGLHCGLNNRAGGIGATSLFSSDFSDAKGWGAADTGGTLMFADINHDGRADVCGRSQVGIVCATAKSSGTGFNPATLWTGSFSDSAGFGPGSGFWRSIRIADVNGDGYPDICGRNASGVVCAINTQQGWFYPATLWSSDFSDSAGYGPAQYSSTLALGDVNGDGKADLCLRSAAGIQCAMSNGAAFVNTHQASFRGDFSDAGGWGASPAYYGSIRLADVNGDGYADLCGRNATGIVCAISTGLRFDAALAVLSNGFTDALGWSDATRGTSIQLADLNHDGRADVCGRSSAGLLCSTAP